MKRILIALVLGVGFSAAIAQQRPGGPPQTPATGGNPAGGPGRSAAGAAKQEPKPYKEVITDKA
ncbi:MAG TPA: hypothetical protein VE035_08825, partial [Puia sp.]|nr:hypothetical protein [Puia sp.]